LATTLATFTNIGRFFFNHSVTLAKANKQWTTKGTFEQCVVVVSGLGDELQGHVLVAEVVVGAAADVVLVQADLGGEANQGPIPGLHVFGIETPIENLIRSNLPSNGRESTVNRALGGSTYPG
jgi:hypothetical protein